MHIKRIVIQGFKTYKNATVIDLLSPHHNVVVGRNGSGKSNFFAAIRFVLSDAYTHMEREERQGLIHEGNGTVMSAYVEIIFDNTDRRLPISKDEVAVRRTIGLKKDDYSLDSKSATRADVMNMLESAGFSRSNPYYIVPQGKITGLTNSKDADRLALLKDVSGAKVFETKLKESQKEMMNSHHKRDRIDEALKSIDDRLSDLQIESKDFKKYQTLDRTRKVLEFKIFDRELSQLSNQIDEIIEKQDSFSGKLQQDLAEIEKRERVCIQLEETISKLNTSLKVTTLEHDQINSEVKQKLSEQADRELKLKELKTQLERDEQEAALLKHLIQHYEQLVRESENKLQELRPRLEKERKREYEIRAELQQLSSKQRALYSKQNRFLKFFSKDERDQWLQEEIKTLTTEVAEKEAKLTPINEQVSQMEEEISQFTEKVSQLNDVLLGGDRADILLSLRSKSSELKARITELTDKRKSLWRDEMKYRSMQDSLANDLQNAEHTVNQTMDQAQVQGLAAVSRLTQQLNLTDSVYGPLAELFHVNDKYKTAAELIAGGSLFHVVVDNDKTAAILMDELIKTKSGRVSFIPLNRMNPPVVSYPDGQVHKCIPLIKKIKYSDENLEPVMRQIFGRALVCSSLASGSELARLFNLTAITLDGDRADNRGALTGGFRDYKRSRLEALEIQKRKRNDLKKTADDLEECLNAIEKVNQDITATQNLLHQNTKELEGLETSTEPMKEKIAQLEQKISNNRQSVDSLNRTIDTLQSNKESLLMRIGLHKEELNSEFASSLLAQELRELETINASIAKTESDLDRAVTETSELEALVTQHEAEITDNYRPHLHAIQAHKSADSHEIKLKIQEAEYGFNNVQTQVREVQSRMEKLDSEVQKLTSELDDAKKSLQEMNEQQLQTAQQIEDFRKSNEKDLSMKTVLEARKEEVQKRIRDLGAIPEEAFQLDKYEKMSSNQLMNKLTQLSSELNNYSHINKKAVEQFSTFNRQRDELSSRRDELEQSRESIDQLISNLQLQKAQAITKSFKQVALSFKQIFETLVPAGTGKLVLHHQSTNTQNEEVSRGNETGLDAETLDTLSFDVNEFTGVSISVSFNSKHDEQQRIEQLSGGQKSLCAIALILAIQKCDPAPFYLFDEIDANLDTQYRTAVASMINVLSKGAQFICTTFRPEMLQVADKFFGIMYSNKVSSVAAIDKEEALSFVEGQIV